MQNPAAYGSFPRFLELARERGSISLEEAVHKMSGASAARLGLEDLGVLAEGKRADITVFDWEQVRDRTTAGQSDASPVGIEQVFVDGRPLKRDGRIVRSC